LRFSNGPDAESEKNFAICTGFSNGSDGTRTRDLRRDRPSSKRAQCVSAAAVAVGLIVAAATPGRRYVARATALAAAVSLGVTVAYLARGSGRSSELLLAEAFEHA
jgi:hypothetical protein